MRLPPYNPSASAASSHPTRVPRRRWRIALLLSLGVIANFFDRVNLSVSREALHQTFGLSVITFGYLSSAFSWTYALMQLPSGMLLDRLGVRRVGRASALLWSSASLLSAISPGLGTFFAARFLLGAAESPTFPANAKALGYWFPQRERTLATAMTDAAAKLASAIGVPLVGLLVLHFGWRWSFATTGLISFCYFMLFYRFYRNPSEDPGLLSEERRYVIEGGAQPETPTAAKHQRSTLLWYLLRSRKVLGLALGWGAYNYSFYLLLTWLPSYLSTSLHMDLLHSAFYTSVPWLFAALTDFLIGGWLVDFLITRGWDANRVRRAVLLGGTCFGLAILGASTARTPIAALCWISLALGGLAAAAPVAWTVPSLIAPRESVGTLASIANLSGQLAAITAPIITGYIVSATSSFASAFVTATLILLLGIFGYGVLLGHMEPIAGPGEQAS
jgi:MFS transporter, ACS family, D-galactonate transporter